MKEWQFVISCNQYDYVEIACMHKLPVRVLLVNQEQVIGLALTTKIVTDHNHHKQECMIIEADNNQIIVVELAQIIELSVTQSNPYFESINFRNGNLIK